MLTSTRGQVIAIVAMLVFVAIVAVSPSNQNAVFQGRAEPTVKKIASADPAALCASGEVIRTEDGYPARCSTVGVDGPSHVYSVTVAFYHSAEDAKAKPQEDAIGWARLVFEKPGRLTGVTYQRKGGVPFD